MSSDSLRAADARYFRLRGWIPVPAYLAVLVYALTAGAPPSWTGDVAGALLVVCGLALRLAARLEMGRSSDTRRLHSDRLVTRGVYAWSRNPIYIGNIAIATGIAVVAGVGWLALCLAVFVTGHYLRVIRAEERALGRRHGAAYARYCAEVGRLAGRRLTAGLEANLRRARREMRIVGFVTGVAAILYAVRWLRY